LRRPNGASTDMGEHPRGAGLAATERGIERNGERPRVAGLAASEWGVERNGERRWAAGLAASEWGIERASGPPPTGALHGAPCPRPTPPATRPNPPSPHFRPGSLFPGDRCMILKVFCFKQ
jgi:hypothetical protein